MKISTAQLLSRLGAGEPIAALCKAAGIPRDEFDHWWRQEAASRVPEQSGTLPAGVGRAVHIDRDEWGVPHIRAESDDDLFLGFGYAMAQDRLFQLDWLRRKGTGRLSEIVGPDGLEQDTIARTAGLRGIAEAEWRQAPDETRRLLEAFTRGVNSVIDKSRERLPIEFDLLGYEPEPWSPVDCLVIETEFRYYLTVRYPAIAGPELARRALGDGPLLQAFLQGEADGESVVPPGAYPSTRAGIQPVGATVSDTGDGAGSNNWVVSGARTATSQPMVASDPHIAFAAVSCWYEVHLSGGSFEVVGMAYIGMPAVMFGRTANVAWGITNNICSQRDLYKEKTDAAHPGSFLFDGKWEPAHEREEVIQVKGAEPVRKVIRSSRNGPIVDEILPAAARNTGPVSLRWLGFEYCGWLTSLLGMDRAESGNEFRAALDGWLVPTWHLVFAETGGKIGYQAAGRIPLRNSDERGYRPGWDPSHQWLGLIPQEGMPSFDSPKRGWIASANNRTAPEDFPYPLYGRWSSGHRAQRVRQMIEERGALTRQDIVEMQQDAMSLRAVDCVPRLIKALSKSEANGAPEAVSHLRTWDHRMETDRVGATIFDVFFTHWSKRVAQERFLEVDTAEALAGAAAGLASALLAHDDAGWFSNGSRAEAIETAMQETLAELGQRLGPDMSSWHWGRLHKIQLRHVLSGRGDLGELLDRGGQPVKGNGVTVCNTGYDPNYLAPMGANYRLISDLSVEPPGMHAVDAQGSSGHPGSVHYGDQLEEWISGRYHFLPLDPGEAAKLAKERLVLEPLSVEG